MNANIYRRPLKRKKRAAERKRKTSFRLCCSLRPFISGFCSLLCVSTIKIKETAVKRHREKWMRRRRHKKAPFHRSDVFSVEQSENLHTKSLLCYGNDKAHTTASATYSHSSSPHVIIDDELFFGVRRRVRYRYKFYGEWEIDCGGILLILLMPSRVRLKLKAFIERFTIATHSNILSACFCVYLFPLIWSLTHAIVDAVFCVAVEISIVLHDY